MFLKTTVIKFNLSMPAASAPASKFHQHSRKAAFEQYQQNLISTFTRLCTFSYLSVLPFPLSHGDLHECQRAEARARHSLLHFHEKNIFFIIATGERVRRKNSSYKFFRVISIPQKVNRKNMEQKSNSILHRDNGLFNGAVLHAHVSHWTLNFPPSIRLKSHLNAFFSLPSTMLKGHR